MTISGILLLIGAAYCENETLAWGMGIAGAALFGAGIALTIAST